MTVLPSHDRDAPPRPRVVVVGAGFAGLAAARHLAAQPVAVTLIDRHDYHLFTPLLYQVASALLTPFEIVRPVRTSVSRRGRRPAAFRLATVSGFDLDHHTVMTDRGEVPYDFLVVACGSVTSFPGAAIARHALGLKDLDDAVTLRGQIMERLEAAAWEPDEARRRSSLAFVIVGGGPTGVEFAGALGDLTHLLLRRGFAGLDPAEISITIVESEATLLTTFGAQAGQDAREALTRKGIRILRGRVKSVKAATVTLADGRRLPSGLTVWTAGVKASALGGSLASRLSKGGTVPVDPTLRLPDHPDVFVIGDLAAVERGDTLLPMLAAVASQEGAHVARSIGHLVTHDETAVAPFEYHDRGVMATNGRYAAVVHIGRLQLHGLAGWLTWLAVHIALLSGFRNRILVAASWVFGFVLQDRPVQLIGPRPAHAHGPDQG